MFHGRTPRSPACQVSCMSSTTASPTTPPSARGRKQSLVKDQKRAFHPEIRGWSHHPAVPSLPRDRRAQEDLGDPSHPVQGTSKGAPLTQPCPVLPVTHASSHQVCDQPKQEEGCDLTYKPSSDSSRSRSSGDTDLALGHRGRHAQVPQPGWGAGGWSLARGSVNPDCPASPNCPFVPRRPSFGVMPKRHETP